MEHPKRYPPNADTIGTTIYHRQHKTEKMRDTEVKLLFRWQHFHQKKQMYRAKPKDSKPKSAFCDYLDLSLMFRLILLSDLFLRRSNYATDNRKLALNRRFHSPIRPKYEHRFLLNNLYWYRLLKTKAIRE